MMEDKKQHPLTVNIGPFIVGITTANKKQLQGLVRERNEYRRLLNKCLSALNVIPNTPLSDGVSTYMLASEISVTFKQFDCH